MLVRREEMMTVFNRASDTEKAVLMSLVDEGAGQSACKWRMTSVQAVTTSASFVIQFIISCSSSTRVCLSVGNSLAPLHISQDNFNKQLGIQLLQNLFSPTFAPTCDADALQLLISDTTIWLPFRCSVYCYTRMASLGQMHWLLSSSTVTLMMSFGSYLNYSYWGTGYTFSWLLDYCI